MSDGIIEINYDPSKTGAAFHHDDTFFKCIIGPVGSGSSSILVMDALQRALSQEPHKGVRKSRSLFIRKTYQRLQSTTIKTFNQWIPEKLCRIKKQAPLTGRIQRKLPDGTFLDWEVEFLALDDESSIDKLTSLEVTNAYVNEMREIDVSVIKILRGRVGRYPSKKEGGPTWRGICADTNAPRRQHWIRKLFDIRRPKGHRLYKQPPGLLYDPNTKIFSENPEAENVQNLPGGFQYYLDQVNDPDADMDYIRTHILNEYGSLHDGQPVHPSFDSYSHVSRVQMEPDPDRTLYIGVDWGFNPAAVFLQFTPNGGIAVFSELVPRNITFTDFVDKHIAPHIEKNYPGYEVLVIGDPAGINRDPLMGQSMFDHMRSRGISAEPAPGNNKFLSRRGAVDYFLGRENGFKANRATCDMLIEGLAGGYVFKKSQGEQDTASISEPKKNKFSHIVEALHYPCLWLKEGVIKPANKRQARKIARAQYSEHSGWDPLGGDMRRSAKPSHLVV